MGMIIPEELMWISEKLHTQDNRMTANPIFLIQGELRIGPIQDGFVSDMMFHDPEILHTYYEDNTDPDKWTELMEQYESATLPDPIMSGGYESVWKTIQTCFTEAGCDRYFRENGHNLGFYHDTRVYVDTLNRNLEMIEIRDFLLGLHDSETKRR